MTVIKSKTVLMTLAYIGVVVDAGHIFIFLNRIVSKCVLFCFQIRKYMPLVLNMFTCISFETINLSDFWQLFAKLGSTFSPHLVTLLLKSIFSTSLNGCLTWYCKEKYNLGLFWPKQFSHFDSSTICDKSLQLYFLISPAV